MLMQLPRVVDAGNPINLEAPLNRGLFFCARYFPNGPQNLRAFRNLVKRKEYPTINGTALTKARSGLLKSSGVRNNGSATSYLSYPASMNNFTTRLTGVAIYTPYALGGDYRIINENNQGGTYPFLLRTSTGSKAELFCIYMSGTLLGTTTLTVGRTYQIGFTIGAAGALLYVNGTQEASTTYGGSSMSNAIPLTVGSDFGYGGANGVIEEVRLYNRELSGSEMRQLCNAARGGYVRETNWLDRPFVLSAPAATFAVSGSITGDAGTISGSLEFSPPVFNLTGAITGDAGTISGALAFAPPVFALSGTITGDAGTITGSLAFTPPVFALTGAITGDAGSIAGQLEFSIPEIIISGTIIGDAGSIAGQLEFVVGTITLSGTITGDAGSIAGQLEFIATRTLSGSITGSAGTIAGALSFTIPPEDLAGPGSSGIGPYGSKLRNPLTKMFKT